MRKENSSGSLLSEQEKKALEIQLCKELNQEECRYITEDKELEEAIPQLRNASYLSVDFEMDDNRHAYGRTPALIQIFDGVSVFLIDAVYISDLGSLWEIMENPSKPKLFHACKSDLMLLDEIYDCHPKNIHDLALMHKIISGSSQDIGLKRLLSTYADIPVSKTEQTSNWIKRPLRTAQLIYAAKDVIYLPEVKLLLDKKLEGTVRHKWYIQARKHLEDIRFKPRPDRHKNTARKNKLSPFRAALLKGLWAQRDDLAKKLNKPHYKIIHDKVLVSLCLDIPGSVKEWTEVKGAHPAWRHYREAEERQRLVEQLRSEKGKYSDKATKRYGKALRSSMPDISKPVRLKREALLLNLQELAKDYNGEDIQALLLSKRIIEEALEKGLSVFQDWQITILKEIAEKHNLDISLLEYSFFESTESELEEGLKGS